MLLETRFTNVKRYTQESGLDVVEHIIPQFIDFNEGMAPVREVLQQRWEKGRISEREASANYLSHSEVVFILPHTFNPAEVFHPTPPMVSIVGNGMGLLEIYTSGVYSANSREENMREVPTIWKLFSVNNFEGRGNRRFSKARIGTAQYLDGLYTTEISPFLKSGDYPIVGQRIYNFWTGPSTHLEVVADRAEEGVGDKMKIIFHPDPRDLQPIHITTLNKKGDSWHFSRPKDESQAA